MCFNNVDMRSTKTIFFYQTVFKNTPPISLSSGSCIQEIGDVLKAVGQYPTKDEEKTLLKDHSDGKFVVAKQFYAMVKVWATLLLRRVT